MKSDDFKSRLKTIIDREKSRSAFAKKCGVAESLLRNYLDGPTLPGMDKLVAIAEAADVSVEWLATGHKPQLDGRLAREGREGGEGYHPMKTEVMREVILEVEKYLQGHKLEMPPEKKADLIMYLYEEFEGEDKIEKGKIIKLLQIAS